MSEPRETHKDAKILFCPFCRDGFEGLVECPEHELTLLPLDRLPKLAEQPVPEITFFVDPRFGRGGVFLGALLVIAGFFGPFVRAGELDASALEVAVDGAHNLWFTPGAALAVFWVLWARRGRRLMRDARVAVAGLALIGGLPLIYTSRRIALVAGAHAPGLEWRWGFVVMVTGLVVAGLASTRLGAVGRSPGD